MTKTTQKQVGNPKSEFFKSESGVTTISDINTIRNILENLQSLKITMVESGMCFKWGTRAYMQAVEKKIDVMVCNLQTEVAG